LKAAVLPFDTALHFKVTHYPRWRFAPSISRRENAVVESRRKGGRMSSLRFPEMVIIFVIVLLLFGPRSLPALSEKFRVTRRAAEIRGYPLPLIVAFAMFSATALIYVLR
jgi:hypothetical protein